MESNEEKAEVIWGVGVIRGNEKQVEVYREYEELNEHNGYVLPADVVKRIAEQGASISIALDRNEGKYFFYIFGFKFVPLTDKEMVHVQEARIRQREAEQRMMQRAEARAREARREQKEQG